MTLISAFLISTLLTSIMNPVSADMRMTEDVFGGSFSQREMVVAPGQTFDVTFSLRPTVNVPNTVVSFVLPADLVTLVSGNQEWTGDLKKGELLTLTLSLAANGEVEANLKADVEAWPLGKEYQSSYYLRVATPNSRFSTTATSDSMEPGFFKQMNPQYELKTTNIASSRALGSSVAPLSTSGTFEVKGRFTYLNEDGGYSSARYMQVRLRDNNDASWSAIGWTNGTGHFDFVAANSASGRSPILDIIAEGSWDWKGTDTNGAQYWWSTGVLATNVADGWVWTNYGLSPGNNNDILQAGDAVYAETQMIYDWTGYMRSKVTIRWPRESWPHSHGDYIDLPAKTTAGWDHVTVQHEEGHCVMWALYGAWPAGSGPDPHYIWSESSNGFAFAEGWAEFMECAPDNEPGNVVGYYNSHGGNIETNDWFNCVTNGNMDGAIVEGSIASILWDIYDPVNIAGDNDHMAWGFDEIFTVMQNDKPQNMLEFWDDWVARWPDNSTSKGPLCDIYYHYGIDKDWFNPWGSVTINGGATFTNSRTVTLTLNGDDWGVGVKYMRFSEDYGTTWGGWYNYAPTFTYTIASPNDGWKYVDVQYADLWWMSKAGTIYDGIGLDTKAPTGSIIINGGAATTATTSVTLSLTYSDAYSGVYQVRYQNSGGAWSAWEAPNPTKAWSLTTGAGTKTVNFQIKDNAGIISSTYFDTITLTSSSEIIVDNSAASFVGSWPASTYYSGFYGANYQYNSAGSGADSATWSFSIPTAGNWQVYAWWTSAPNKASNAPYTVNHATGSTGVTVNQQVNGGSWQLLGTFSFNAGAYSIRLTDNANGEVVADAIRLVFAG